MKTAHHRKNGAWGYKALVRYADGRTHIPVRKNFATPEAARDYAQRWIDANDAPRPVRVQPSVLAKLAYDRRSREA
jgi:hypothetical protein